VTKDERTIRDALCSLITEFGYDHANEVLGELFDNALETVQEAETDRFQEGSLREHNDGHYRR
jgi:hypothetical protein